MNKKQSWVRLGSILRPQGNKGEVKVNLLLPLPEKTKTVFIDDNENNKKQYCVRKIRQQNKFVIFQFENIQNINQAEEIRGKTIWLPEFKLPKNMYLVKDIIGLEVYTIDGEYLGKITEVTETGANDVYTIKNVDKEFMIPALKKVVVEITKTKMTVALLPELKESTLTNTD